MKGLQTEEMCMEIQLFQQFKDATTNNQQAEFQSIIINSGYSLFSKFIDGFREAIRRYDEHESILFIELVKKAAILFPNPILFSPHWQSIWEDFGATVHYKNSVFARISKQQRIGEWQIILDNPFTNQEVVCYPALDFIEAAYLYGYFRPELKENEYVRLQKVDNCIVEFGLMNEKNSVS
jgi:hypothetical protein